MNNIRLGVDLGGTKIEIVALGHNHEILLRERIKAPRDDYKATLNAVVNLVNNAETQLNCHCPVGVATPGAISPSTGKLKNSNSTWLNHKPLRQDLELALKRKVRMENDANCFVLSEWVDGAAQGVNNVFGVIVGTGTGGGIVINGQLLRGANAIAGEWGHNALPWRRTNEMPGPQCYCGQCGCIETYLSGPGLSRSYYELTQHSCDALQIATRAEQGEMDAQAILSIYEDRMARALASVINIIDPDVIILGGGLSNVQRLYNNVPAIWHKYVFSDVLTTRLIAPKFGDSSGVRGAAWLWP